MNVKLLRQIKEHILAEPKRFYMSIVGTDDMSWIDADRIPKCGTVGCFAGWACFLSKRKMSSRTARELLDLTVAQAHELFYGNPPGFEDLWSDDGSKKTAQLAAQRIDLFIKTKGKK